MNDLLILENNHYVLKTSRHISSDFLNYSHKKQLVNFMFKLRESFQFSEKTLYDTIKLFDDYCSSLHFNLHVSQIQKTLLTCLYVFYKDYKLMKCEYLLKKIQTFFNKCPTLFDFKTQMFEYLHIPKTNLRVHFLCDLCLMDRNLCNEFKPSLVIVAIFYDCYKDHEHLKHKLLTFYSIEQIDHCNEFIRNALNALNNYNCVHHKKVLKLNENYPEFCSSNEDKLE